MTIFITILWMLSTMVYYALVSRWHGGGFFKAPKTLKNIVWAMPFGIAVGQLWYLARYPAVNMVWEFLYHFPEMGRFDFETLVIGICAAIGFLVFLASWATKATGHGNGIDVGHMPQGKPEKLEWPIVWLRRFLDPATYDIVFLIWLGLLSTLGTALAIGALCPIAGIIIAIGGALKSRAYVIGWRWYPTGQGVNEIFGSELDEATEIGELLTGLYVGAAFGFGCVMVYVRIHYF